jgi:predicted DNA-binding transcriptional regulator AlpA
MPDPIRMTAREIAEMCGVAIPTVYRWAEQQPPPAVVANRVQIAGTVRFLVPQAEIDRITKGATNVRV